MRFPVPFEIGDQCRAEMAGRLLARVDRHVAAERIERLLPDTNGAAIAGSADNAGTGEAVDHLIERRIHRRRGRDLVADEPPFRRIAIEPPAVEDRLPRDAIAGEAP